MYAVQEAVARMELDDEMSDDLDPGMPGWWSLTVGEVSMTTTEQHELRLTLGPKHGGMMWLTFQHRSHSTIISILMVGVVAGVVLGSFAWPALVLPITYAAWTAWRLLAGRTIVIPPRFEAGAQSDLLLTAAARAFNGEADSFAELHTAMPRMGVFERISARRNPPSISPFA